MEVLHQGLALLTPQWDQFVRNHTHIREAKVEPEEKREKADDHLEIISLPENEPTHTDQPVEPAPEREQGPVST